MVELDVTAMEQRRRSIKQALAATTEELEEHHDEWI